MLISYAINKLIASYGRYLLYMVNVPCVVTLKRIMFLTEWIRRFIWTIISNKKFRLIIIVVLITIIFDNYTYYLHKPMELYMQKVPMQSKMNIFFTETSCLFKKNVKSGTLRLNTKQVCSIYSTAILNPTRPVILYHSCPLLQNLYEKSGKAEKLIQNLPNVFIMNDDFEHLARDILLKNITNDLKKSKLDRRHAADVLRLSLLQQYGGVFIDFNFISLRSLNSLNTNFLACESSEEFTRSIFQFDFKEKGNEFLNRIIQDLAESYYWHKSMSNIKELITRNYFQYCNIQYVDCSKIAMGSYIGKYNSKKCGLTVYNSTTFFPIDRKLWRALVTPKFAEQVLNRINKSTALYSWKHIAKRTDVIKGENSAYELVVKKYCQEIYDTIAIAERF